MYVTSVGKRVPFHQRKIGLT